jgi:hypothetical protein
MDEEETGLDAAETADDDTGAALGDLSEQYDIPGTSEAFATLTKSSDDARTALRNARVAILTRKYNNALPLLAASAALGAPTRSGSFAESFGNMSQALMGPLREKEQFERERQKELLGVDTGIAGIDQRMAQSHLSLAAMRAKLAQAERNLPLEKVDENGKHSLMPRYQARGKPFFVPPTAGTTVNVNSEKSLYEQLGQKQADAYSAQYAAAQAAPEAYQRASRIVKLLDKGAFTGAGADYKKAIGRALHAVGIDLGRTPTENTEALVAEMARGTLDLVKSSGLAGSQGLTEGERKFLERAVAGQITLEDKTLRYLANLNQRVSRKSIGSWNDLYGRLSEPELKKLGMKRVEMPEEDEVPLVYEDMPGASKPRSPTRATAPSSDVDGRARKDWSGQQFDEDTAPAYDPAEEDVINFEDLR